MTKNTSVKNADQYNDPDHNYLKYWDGRDYEHAAEEIAIRRLLSGKNFIKAIDVGGGYGRLSVVLKDFSEKVYLCEPSQQQHDIAKGFLKGKPKVEHVLTKGQVLPFDDGEVDLVLVVRVIHHIPDPAEFFAEISRVVKDDGYFLIEFANYSNFKNRIKHSLKAERMPREPVDIRTDAKSDIPFVNHNPKTVKKQLAHAGFRVEKTLSVSNFRSSSIKKLIPKSLLLKLEKSLQKPLAKSYFGPSTVYLLRKRSK
ncbi:MAG: class I SAM-dependent methyltransferase [bacterium]|nr:class I SAM-dependent methyltransferase [bacterium]